MQRLIVRVEDIESRTAVDHEFTRTPVRMGRSARNDLCLPQRFVSAWHGLIEFDTEGIRYTDLGSTNGTLLDGSSVEAHTSVPLEHGAEVVIGSLRFTFPQREGDEVEPRRPGVTAPEEASPAHGRVAGPPTSSEPPPAPGGITAVMRRLAAAPVDDFERAWRRVLVPRAVVGRFELVREIGRGSCGIVFEARDRQLGRLVAFKAVKPGRESQVMLRQELLQREAEAAAQLNHPNIVSLYDVGTCESGPYLIMELLGGENLRDRIQRGRIPLDESLEIAIEIAWALDHAHASHVIHRDLKPANIFLCTGGHVKVLDFGIAHVFGAGASNAIGTPAYMAPEQWRGTQQDARTDVFAAAATLAEMVTGRLPYRVTSEWSAALAPGARPSLDAPGAPPQLVALLRRGLSPNPESRPRDGHAWLAALLDVHELLDRAQPVEVVSQADSRSISLPERGRRDDRTRRTDAFMLALAALVAASALAYLLLG